MSKIYAIRRKSDGKYYRKGRSSYGKDRNHWVDNPEKAWLTWDNKNIELWFAKSWLWKNKITGMFSVFYEVVEFDLTEVK